jgi:Pvc16 N-terminal domain
MSDARAIEAVTETLRGIVDTGVKRVAPGARAITLPPHEVAASQELRVNVFLYQAAMDGALRNTAPVNVAPGESGQAALPLVLHYLITPYAPNADDVQAHRLLGGALQALHSHPLLTATDLADAAPYSDIAHQVESVRICWQPLDDKDIYSLWSIFQAPYRVCAAFELRVVLIDSTTAGRAPLPVLSRGSTGRGPVVAASVGYPEITDVIAPLGQPSALPGERVRLLGAGLTAAHVTVLLSHPVLASPITVTPDSATGSEVTFTVPAGAPAGFGTVALSLSTPGTSDQLSNDAPFGVGPTITSPLPAHLAASAHPATLTITCSPAVRAGQHAVLLVGGSPATAAPITADTTHLTFTVGPVPARDYHLRLRIDGADSRLIADRTARPYAFDPSQSVTVT